MLQCGYLNYRRPRGSSWLWDSAPLLIFVYVWPNPIESFFPRHQCITFPLVVQSSEEHYSCHYAHIPYQSARPYPVLLECYSTFPPHVAYSTHPYKSLDILDCRGIYRDPTHSPFGKQNQHSPRVECTIPFLAKA